MANHGLIFALGYQQPENGEPFAAIVADYRDKVGEVYFPWVGMASGRAALGRACGETDWDAQRILEEDLQELRRLGVKLDLLFNANCYGGRALSESLENEVRAVIEHLGEVCGGADIITTTSLMIARTVKNYYPAIEVRASVNMRIGTTQAMGYVADLFDSFYLQRDWQRDVNYVKKVHDWCGRRGKKLCLLANSGCLRFCPGQSFHDNMVAHDAEIGAMKNVKDWIPHVCWGLYRQPENFVEILKSTWIRPEDIRRYEGLADTVKLATRMHSHPRMVIGAYAEGRFSGNLLDLLEPAFSTAFAPCYLDNAAFPADWAEKIAACPADCEACDYCRRVLDQVLKKYPNT